MRIRVLGVSLLLLTMVAGAYGGESGQDVPPVTVDRSAQHTLESVRVGDTFVIRVRVPASYAVSKKKYPVLYVLDGDKCFGLAADTAEWLARAKFQDFLAGELFPFIESCYRALPEDRAVAGISLGGLFGAFSLFTHPTLFQRYILIAPAFVRDNRRLWQYEAEYQARSKVRLATVFTAVGSKDEPAILKPWAEFSRLVEERHCGGLQRLTQMYPGESHISVLPGALSRGIRCIYGK